MNGTPRRQAVHVVEDGWLWQTGVILATENDVPDDAQTAIFCVPKPWDYEPWTGNDIFIPFADRTVPVPLETWRALCDVVRGYAHDRVIVVGRYGENRSGLVAAMILVARGHTPEDALRMVRAGPATLVTGRTALWNPEFAQQLLAMDPEDVRLTTVRPGG